MTNYCEGCFTNARNYCAYEKCNVGGRCPCSKCVVKVMCNKTCDEFEVFRKTIDSTWVRR